MIDSYRQKSTMADWLIEPLGKHKADVYAIGFEEVLHRMRLKLASTDV